jgi:hypothetical protein
MLPEDLSDDLLAIMRVIREKGGTDCSGSCHHRKPGEFHCHTVGQDLNISSSGVKERILALVRMGLLDRNRLEREGTYPLVRFTVSAKGEKLLAGHGSRDEK